MPADKAKRPGKTPRARKTSGEDFRVLFERSPDAIYIHDFEGRILETNKAASEIMGYSPAEFRKMRVMDVTSEQAAAKVPARLEKMLEEGGAIFESEHKKRCGALLPVEINIRPIDFRGKKAVIATVRDITNRKRAEETLLENESRMRAITDSAQDAIIMMGPDGNISYWNPAAERILGYTSAEAMGRNLHALLAPARYRAAHLAAFPAFRATGQGAAVGKTLKLEARRKDGAEISVQLSLSAVKNKGAWSAMGILRDNTALQRAEDTLRASEEKYRKLIETTATGYLIVDRRGRVMDANSEYVRLSGHKELHEILGRSVTEWTADHEKRKNAEAVARCVRDGLVRDLVIDYADKGGRVTPVEINATVDGKGEDLRIISLCRDISGRKLAAEKITRLNEDLKHTISEMVTANKELEAFIYSVSHDLRTPLRHMTVFSRLLREEAGDALNAQTRHYLDVVFGSAKKMDGLITSLLAFSKLARAKPELREFSGRELAEEAAAEIREDCEDREIEWRIGTLPALKGDRRMLKQVFMNLLDNAVKYSAGKKPARIEIFAGAEGDETVIGVRDNGIGFDMKQYDRLFGVFQRLHSDKDFDGTGIGLANVKNVISKHGGRVWAESVPDKATTFYFSLPAADAGERPPKE